MNHLTKIRRAHQHAAIGRYRGTAAAMEKAVPTEIVAALTGRQLGILLDALAAVSSRSKAIAEAEACGDGFIWDAVNQQLRDISPVQSCNTTPDDAGALEGGSAEHEN